MLIELFEKEPYDHLIVCKQTIEIYWIVSDTYKYLQPFRFVDLCLSITSNKFE